MRAPPDLLAGNPNHVRRYRETTARKRAEAAARAKRKAHARQVMWRVVAGSLALSCFLGFWVVGFHAYASEDLEIGLLYWALFLGFAVWPLLIVALARW